MYKDININGTVMDVPSVSQICGLLDKSDALIPWGARKAVEYIQDRKNELFETAHSFDNICQSAVYAYKDVNKEAKDIGTDVHKILENYILHGDIVDGVQSFDAFLDFEKFFKMEYIECEKFVKSNKNLYAGTIDLICKINGQDFIVDFKTSKAIYPGTKLQLAAYRQAYFEETGKILNVAILRLDKESGEYEFKDFTKNIEKSEKAFLSLLDFYYHEKRRRLKNNTRVKEIWS